MQISNNALDTTEEFCCFSLEKLLSGPVVAGLLLSYVLCSTIYVHDRG
jgi:hypothetical protein